MNAALLASIAGIVLSLLFSYVPKLSTGFAVLDGVYKRLIMAGLLLIVAACAFGLSCAGLYSAVSCDQPGAVGLVEAFIAALIANQSAYAISPETKGVRQAKLDSAG
jgi:TRAP-type mannitol/chloroaromatic compound transport system permease large subunit